MAKNSILDNLASAIQGNTEEISGLRKEAEEMEKHNEELKSLLKTYLDNIANLMRERISEIKGDSFTSIQLETGRTIDSIIKSLANSHQELDGANLLGEYIQLKINNSEKPIDSTLLTLNQLRETSSVFRKTIDEIIKGFLQGLHAEESTEK